MTKWDKIQAKVNKLDSMDLDLMRAFNIMDSLIESNEKVDKIKEILVVNYDSINEIAEDIYREEFLEVVANKLYDIQDLLSNLQFRYYDYGRGSGWHLNIKSPIIAGQEESEYQFQSDIFYSDLIEKMKELDLDYKPQFNGRSGGWLNLVTEQQIKDWLDITGWICDDELIEASIDDFISLEDFIKGEYDMEDIINELDWTIDTLEDINKLSIWVKDYIDNLEDYYKSKELVEDNLNLIVEDIAKEVKEGKLNKEDLIVSLDTLSNQLKEDSYWALVERIQEIKN